MQTVYIRDNLHEMSNHVFWGKCHRLVICWICPEMSVFKEQLFVTWPLLYHESHDQESSANITSHLLNGCKTVCSKSLKKQKKRQFTAAQVRILLQRPWNPKTQMGFIMHLSLHRSRLRVGIRQIFFLFLDKTICCGYS